MSVPVLAGSVRTDVPAADSGISCAVPETEPGIVMEEIPVNA
jgi:hypothetical protein